MKILKTILSSHEPVVRDSALWLKPVPGGFSLYVLDGGWKPLRLVDDKSSVLLADDSYHKPTDFDKAGSAASAESSAKSYAKSYADGLSSNYDPAGSAVDVQNALLGTADDSPSSLTLFGLKAYIDSQIAALASTE